MTPRGPDDYETGDLPGPPYSADILAELHAGALPGPVAAHIRSQIVDDPAAQTILAALDRTSDDLRTAGPSPVTAPDHIRADVAATLAALGREHPDAADASIAHPGSAPSEHPPEGRGRPPVDLTTARRGRRSADPGGRGTRRQTTRLLLAAAAVLIVAAGSVGVLRLLSASDTAGPGQAPRAQSSSAPGPTGVGGVAALSVLGRTDGAPFGSIEALRRCTAAHLVSADVMIVGSGRILVDGSGAAAILLSTGVAGRFDALVVGLDCDLGNPALISRGIIGG
ncbi:hypothetical protein [Gordonia sp. NPDC058843]|uniref:hypothetical protein n=1 Tax=Gordonia sp. NPDC058843 TaxID=3346648 RepID=UPI003688CB4D